MDFIVEDGTGVPSAASYASVEEADEYFKLVMESKWTSAVSLEKKSALIKASRYVDIRFGSRIGGIQLNPSQGLLFPRVGSNGYDRTIPQLLKRAVYEYGVRALQNPLVPDPQATSGVTTYMKKKKIGPLEMDYAVVSKGIGSTVTEFLSYPTPDNLMRQLLGNFMQGSVYR